MQRDGHSSIAWEHSRGSKHATATTTCASSWKARHEAAKTWHWASGQRWRGHHTASAWYRASASSKTSTSTSRHTSRDSRRESHRGYSPGVSAATKETVAARNTSVLDGYHRSTRRCGVLAIDNSGDEGGARRRARRRVCALQADRRMSGDARLQRCSGGGRGERW